MLQWKSYSGIIISLFFILSAITAACSQPQAAIESIPALKPAEFEVSTITLEPAVVMVGDTVEVTAAVKNIGEVAGTYTADFSLDGQTVESKTIAVDPGSSQNVAFQLSKATAGSHQLAIDSSSAVLTIHNWSPQIIKYDESDVSGTGIYVSGDNGHIVHFTPPNKAFKIQKIKIFGVSKNATIFSKNVMTMRIWDKESDNQLWSQDFPWTLFLGATWATIKVPNIRVNDDFQVELVTHSDPHGGDLIGSEAILQIGGVPPSYNNPEKFPILILIGFDYPKSCVNPPVGCPETRSGYSYMGKLIDPGKDTFKGINWLIRVEGEGAAED
jgi:CARDB